jgi:hypothetical protein
VFPKGGGRSASRQAAIQLYCIGVTLAIAIASGVVTGIMLRLPLFKSHSVLFNDDQIWEVPEESKLKGTPARIKSQRSSIIKSSLII